MPLEKKNLAPTAAIVGMEDCASAVAAATKASVRVLISIMLGRCVASALVANDDYYSGRRPNVESRLTGDANERGSELTVGLWSLKKGREICCTNQLQPYERN